MLMKKKFIHVFHDRYSSLPIFGSLLEGYGRCLPNSTDTLSRISGNSFRILMETCRYDAEVPPTTA